MEKKKMKKNDEKKKGEKEKRDYNIVGEKLM
jgi:hypothetical protein